MKEADYNRVENALCEVSDCLATDMANGAKNKARMSNALGELHMALQEVIEVYYDLTAEEIFEGEIEKTQIPEGAA